MILNKQDVGGLELVEESKGVQKLICPAEFQDYGNPASVAYDHFSQETNGSQARRGHFLCSARYEVVFITDRHLVDGALSQAARFLAAICIQSLAECVHPKIVGRYAFSSVTVNQGLGVFHPPNSHTSGKHDLLHQIVLPDLGAAQS